MYLIVGLGNPGREYDHTRHNVGFDVVEILSQKLNIPVARTAMKSLIGEGFYNGQKIVLVKPQTYMNLSGTAVVELLNWYKCPIENLAVVYDDIDLPDGALRIRKSGSAGTHNGMRNIVYLTGSDQFPRFRVGTGSKPEGWDLKDWVLSHYQTEEERKVMYTAFDNASEAILTWIREGMDAAMRSFNTGKTKKAENGNG